MKNVKHCILRCIISISVSRQGILLLFEIAYKFFDPSIYQKAYSYIYIYNFITSNFMIFLHVTFFIHPPKKCFAFSEAHTRFRLYLRKKNCYIFSLEIN